MKKIALFSFMVVAVLCMMTTRAWCGSPNWNAQVNIVNSGESPVQLSLINNGDAHAKFPDGSGSWTLQPGQSTNLQASCDSDTSESLQWNIVYNFYDGTDSINQRISTYGYISGSNVNCASPSQSGMFSVSAGIFVDAYFPSFDVGAEMASWMGLSGTGETIVGDIIDFGLIMAGDTPSQSTGQNLYYSITIGQNDYNLDKLAGVDWSNSVLGSPPPVTLVKGQQIFQYLSAGKPWLTSQNLYDPVTIADFTGAYVSIGIQNAYVANYGIVDGAPTILNYTNFPGYYQNVVQVSRNPNGPQFVAAFDDEDVWYSDGTNVNHLYGISNVTDPILSMCVNWNYDSSTSIPQIVIGSAGGQVMYYNGTAWSNLTAGPGIGGNFNSSIMHIEAYWDDASNLQLVAGLGNGDIWWWNGYGWERLYDPTGFAPVYQLHATFTDGTTTPPQVLATLFDGSVGYYAKVDNLYTWTTISQPDNNYCIIDVAPANFTFPTFLAGFSDGHVDVYDGASATWYEVQPNRPGNRVQFLSGNWDQLHSGQPSFNVPYVYSCNYQFTYNVFNYINFNYPAIPNVSNACGDIDGDGKGDLISVEGSNWYMWYSSNQYSTRYGPYDLGVFGKPVIGDLDGDGKGDLIMVKGAHWYAWTSSSGYTKRIDRDLGIYGSPLTGDIDGDGKDDLIMVMGSIWYAWTSSSGYTERLGPYDLCGIKGLPAAGDIDGDGKADLVIAVGPNWYTWSAASKYKVRSGPYNMGISGIPKLADIDGDGLADSIVIVGSEWYVWFSSAGYQRFGPYTISLP